MIFGSTCTVCPREGDTVQRRVDDALAEPEHFFEYRPPALNSRWSSRRPRRNITLAAGLRAPLPRLIERMATYQLSVNGQSRSISVAPDMPLLWALRDTLQLRGTKYGCGRGVCGACTVLIDGAAMRSCMTPVGSVGARRITTIEGLAPAGKLHPVQSAWIEEDVPQCGYCQAGANPDGCRTARHQPAAIRR
jgi:hypothetical protein